MKIIFFGDSLTQGTFGISYVDRVAAALPQHQIINKGINGDTSLNLYQRVDEDVIALRPDGVFILVGINDAVSAVEPRSRPYYHMVKHIPGGQLSPVAFRENMRAILGKLKHAHIQTWVGLPPIEYNPAQVAMLRDVNTYAAAVCHEIGVPALDILATLTPKHVPERHISPLALYRRSLEMLFGRRKYDQWRKDGGYAYSFDGVHLTEDGAQRMADLIVPFLRANGVS
jgi:lysophospholipase L1-like esterase